LPKAANYKINGLREVGLALVTAGLVVLLFVAYELVGTNLSEEHSQARLARDFNAAVASVPLPIKTSATTTTTVAPEAKGIGTRLDWKATTPRSSPTVHDPSVRTEALPVTPPGGALDYLEIPAIGVDRYIVQGVAEADLQEGPGHYPGTPLPGQAGNVAIAGHRTTFGAPFFRLNEVHSGDLVYLTDTLGTTWVYSVVRQFVVAPSDVAVLDATRAPELTLTTCNPRFEATSRLVVRAVLLTHLARGIRVPKALPASGTSSVTTSDGGGSPTVGDGSDPPTVGPSPAAAPLSVSAPGSSSGTGGAGPGAVGWGVLALAAWVITRIAAARRRRYSKVAVLFGGALVCLVPLWFAFGNVVDLLPANI
jgi:sortase A